MNAVAKGTEDVLQIFLDIMGSTRTRYCIVGGLAVNAYVEPVVSLDLAVVIEADAVEKVSSKALEQGWKVETFEHSVNLTSSKSDLRIQLQTDPRYQEFLSRASSKDVLGYPMQVASVEDILEGKIWAYSDDTRRRSKRQKDLADILRLLERYPQLGRLVPTNIREKLL